MSTNLASGTNSRLVNTAITPTITAGGAFTMACRVNWTSLTARNVLMSLDGVGFNIFVMEAGSNTLSMSMYNDATATYETASQASLTTNTWYHFAQCWDTTTQTSYVNGVQIDSFAVARSGASISDLTIGSVDGSLQDLVIYDAALSAPEILALYNSRLPKRRTNLVAHYPFFSGVGRVADYSGNGNTLTPEGSPDDGSAEAPVGWGGPAGQAFKASNAGVALIGGSSSSSSAVDSPMLVLREHPGTSQSLVTIDAQMGVAIAESGTVDSTSAATAGIGIVYELSGSSGTTSAGAATAEVATLPSGAGSAASAADAAMEVARDLAGAAGTSSEAAAAMGVLRELADTSATASVAAAAMSMDANLGAGASDGASSATAGLSLFLPTAGDSAASSAATGGLSVEQSLAGAAPMSTAASAFIGNTGFAGDSAAQSAADAAMAVEVRPVGAAPSGSAATGGLSVDVALAGASAATSSSTTAEDIFYGLASTVESKSAASAAMLVDVRLVGEACATSTASNAYTRSAPLPQRTIRMPGNTRATVIKMRNGE